MKKNKSRINIVLFLLICIIFAPKTFAKAEVIETKDIKSEKSIIQDLPNLLADKQLLVSTQFDLRSLINVVVKNQKSTQECWAFAANTALETNLALRENKNYDFSERHMVYATSKTFKDGVNNLAHNREVTSGGNASIAMAYYTSGRGPVLEEDMPFSENESKIYLSEIANKTVQKKVSDYIIFPSIEKNKDDDGNITYTDVGKKTIYTDTEVQAIRNQIKNHIMNYGAVITMTVSGSGYNNYYNYDLDYPALYCNNSNLTPNHQVAIIGWDDNYLVDNFNQENRPSNPGAYLVLNSYGTDNFKYGCYYISYEDVFVEEGLVGVINVDDIDYDNIYQYDELGSSTNICVKDKQELYGANVFEKGKLKDEILTQISIASPIEQEFELYVNSTDGDLTEEKLKKVEVKEKTIRNGYTTIKLENPITLTGEKFVVAVKFTGINQNAYIAIEAPSALYWKTATSKAGQSFCSQDGANWTDLIDENLENTNICIKAFTKITGYNIDSDIYNIDDNYIYKVSPNTTLNDFENNIKSLVELKIIKNDIELNVSDIITTGTTVKIQNEDRYKIVVCGDLTGSGTISSTDISKLKLHLVGSELLNDLEQKAADIDYSGDITITDLSRIKSIMIGLIKI